MTERGRERLMNWAPYADMGGEIRGEGDQTGHHHCYVTLIDNMGWTWEDECMCWVDSPCDHEKRPMCKARAEAVRGH